MSDNLKNILMGIVSTTATPNNNTNSSNLSNSTQPSNNPTSFSQLLGITPNNNIPTNTAPIPQPQPVFNPSAPLPLASTKISYQDLMIEFKRTPIYSELKRQLEEKTINNEEAKKQMQQSFQKFAEGKGFSAQQIQQILQLQKLQAQQHQQHQQQQQQQMQAHQVPAQQPSETSTQSTQQQADDFRTQALNFQRLSAEEKRKYLIDHPDFQEKLKYVSGRKQQMLQQQQQQLQQPQSTSVSQPASTNGNPVSQPAPVSNTPAPSTARPSLTDSKNLLLELQKIYGKNTSFLEVCNAYASHGPSLSEFFNHLKSRKTVEEGNTYIEQVKKSLQDQMYQQFQMNSHMYMQGVLPQNIQQMAAAISSNPQQALNSQLLQQLQKQNQVIQGMAKTASSTSLSNINGSTNSTSMPPPQQPNTSTATNASTAAKDVSKSRRPAVAKEPPAKKEKKADDRSVLMSANVDEEKEMAAKEIIEEPDGTAYRPQESFLNLNNLRTKLQRLAYQKNMEGVSDDALKFMSQAVEFRIRNIMERALEAAQYRQEAFRPKDAILTYTSSTNSLEFSKTNQSTNESSTANSKDAKKDYAAATLNSFTAGVTLKNSASKPILAFDAASKAHATPNKTFPTTTVSKTPNRTYNPNATQSKTIISKDIIRTLEQEEQSCKSTSLQSLYLKYY